MKLLGDSLTLLLFLVVTACGILVVKQRRSAWFVALIGIVLAGIGIAGAWPLPALAYGLKWGADLWYAAPPWTAFRAIWSFFGVMTYGMRANQWIAFVLACAIYAIPYLAMFALLRWIAARLETRSALRGMRVSLRGLSVVAIALWTLLMLTGTAAILARGLSFILT